MIKNHMSQLHNLPGLKKISIMNMIMSMKKTYYQLSEISFLVFPETSECYIHSIIHDHKTNRRMSKEKLQYIKSQLNYKKQHLLPQFMMAVQNKIITEWLNNAKISQSGGKLCVLSSKIYNKRKFGRYS
jgi:hypothetical protein